MRQQFANPIFLSPVNKFPKRFNSLFELRISVQNSLKNMYFLTIKLISKLTPERRKCCFRSPNFKNFTGVYVDLVNLSSKTLDPLLLREWILGLNRRQKWFYPQRDIEKDDLVIMMSPDTPRAKWPIGRVIKTFPGKDGHTRVVRVQVGQQELTRPITKLCPLRYD
jgi:hypothetical protein